MTNFKILISSLFSLLLIGCTSTQICYKDNNTDNSVIKEYIITKKTVKTWNQIKNNSFPLYHSSDNKANYFITVLHPAIDIAILPLQFIYDGLFSWGQSYTADLFISGQLVDSFGKEISNKEFSIHVFDSSKNLESDSNGMVKQSIAINKANLPEDTNTIILKFADSYTNSLTMYDIGEKIDLNIPLEIKYVINKNDFSRYDYTLAPINNPDNIKDSIQAEWVLNSNKGDVLVFHKKTYFSQKNLNIMLNKKKYEERIAYIKSNNRNLDALKLKPSDEDDIFKAIKSLGGNGLRSLIINEQNKLICTPIQIYQIIDEKNILFLLGNMGFVGELLNSCVKREYYDGQVVEIIAVTKGTYTYISVDGSSKTVPKVQIYAIKPYYR